MKSFYSLFQVIFSDRSSLKFIIGVTLGVGFSISVILSTIGIMDGFDYTLRSGLKGSMGDVYFYSRDGFFEFEPKIKSSLKKLNVKTYSGHIQSEAFLVYDGTSKGVSLRGIQSQEFSKILGKNLDLQSQEVAIGKELANLLSLKIGDRVVLAFAKGNDGVSNLPLLEEFIIKKIVSHGVYQKDLRYIYMQLETLQNILKVDERINIVALNLSESKGDFKDSIKQIETFIYTLEEDLGLDYIIKPYWYDFSSLLEAVEFEKRAISLILQVIVLISIFNVLAFVVFINEKRAKEMFLFQALGVSKKQIFVGWLTFVGLIWLGSIITSYILVQIFGLSLLHLPIFQLPGDIYHLGQLQLIISIQDYAVVFGLALLQLLIISIFGLIRVNKKSILHGLRKEFG